MPVLQNGTTQIIPTRNINPGSFASPVMDVQDSQSKIVLVAARNNWPDTGSDVFTLLTEISFDGGATWQLLVSFTALGGNSINPWTGQPEPTSTITMNLPVGTSRKVRCTATVTVTLNTSISMTVS